MPEVRILGLEKVDTDSYYSKSIKRLLTFEKFNNLLYVLV